MLRASTIPTEPKKILEIITKYTENIGSMIALEEAFCGVQNIMKEDEAEEGKPDNRLVNNFAGYISTVNVGYFMGKPVIYTANDDDETFRSELQDFLDYNDEQDENVILAKEASVKGVCYELIYTDSQAKLRIAHLKPESTIVFYDNTIEANMLFAIRYWYLDENTIEADMYTNKEVIRYLFNLKKKTGAEVKRDPHVFDDVPVIEYPNNEERQGDFEKVLSLIDAYDKAQSDTANDFQYFTDAYLLIRNLSGTTDDQIEEMKKKRVLLVDGDGDVTWITKTIQDTATENYKNRLGDDIHKFSMTPNLTDEAFAGNLSGVALEFKLWGIEQVAAQKERKFKRALQRRIELFCNFMKVKGRDYDWRNISITFNRNMPMNYVERIDTAIKLKGIISDSTLLSQLPFIDDPAKEMENMQNEQVIDLDNQPTETGDDSSAVQEPETTEVFPQ